VIDASVARRYARALLALASEEEREEKFGKELNAVLEGLGVSKDAGAFLRNPGFTLEQRHNAVGALSEALRLSGTVVSFLSLLVDRQRMHDLGAIAREYGALVDEKLGRVRATVTSAAELSDASVGRLQDAMEKLTGRTIVLETKTDPSLIGGVVAQVGATQFDGSLRTQLERLREELKSAPV
jgi:F-type H+-transporting ATPase subunit delta